MTDQDLAYPQAGRYHWRYIFGIILQHKRELFFANIIAIFAALSMVPIPLLMPLLVDEVLLHKPGNLVSFTQGLFPQSWHGPVLYILFIL
ncbi:MAG: hypothetical protein PVH16_07725, partial [Thioalkalispiraceae bacterium]